jgi:hypothetical protein
MPLPGGPTDKLGNRYELWWTVSRFVNMLHGQAESIRIEDPGVTKAEFVIISEGQRELHQAKRSHHEGKWSLASLASSDVQLLQSIFAELSGNNARFVFVSSSDARDLAELTERARQAATLEEFESYFISGKVQQENFKKLRKYWKDSDPGIAYEMLQRIEVRTIDERSLEEQVRSGLRALFLADPNAVCAELRRIAEDSIHQTLTRDVLIGILAQCGFVVRRIVKLETAGALVKEVTDRYLDGGRKKLIRNSLIPRVATQTLLERLRECDSGRELVLTGQAGTGKTGCVIEFIQEIRARGIPVLAFRLDRLEPVATTEKLGEQLELEESPALVLTAAATGHEAVLIVDQLDAVSTTSGRSSGFFDAVDDLLAEARGLRHKLKLHVVVVCRAFDWEHDHRLRRLLSENHAKIDVSAFSLDEVRTVLSAEGFRAALFQSRQLELLRLPQNLSLFLDAGFDPFGAPKFNTAKDLFDRYWDEKRQAVAERSMPLQEQWMEVIQLLCDEMTRTQQLSLPREKLDQIASGYVAQMASEGVLTYDGRRFGFGHESFFDYCFARVFIAKDQSLVKFLTASEQHLFRRAQVRQVLTYLRDADHQRYCTELRTLLDSNRVRAHIKDVALVILDSDPNPGNDEWKLLEPWINLILNATANSQRDRDKFATLVWQHFFSSESWFHFADRLGFIFNWLASGNEGLANMAVNYLQYHQRHSADKVAELLEPYVGKGGAWTQRLRYIMEWADLEHSRRFFELFLRLIDDGTLDEARGPVAVNSTFWSMLYGLADARPEWVAEVIAHRLRRRLTLIQQKKSEGERPKWGDLFNNDDFGSKHFHDAASKAPEVFVQNVLPIVLEITDAAVYDEDISPPKRDAVWPVLMEREHESIEGTCLSALVTALGGLAKSESEKLGDVIIELSKRDTYIANYLLLNLYNMGSSSFADEAIGLLSDQPWRLLCGYSDSPYWITIGLIKSAIPLCSQKIYAKFESIILKYAPDYERNTKGYKYSGYACFALLSAIPPQYRGTDAQARYRELERKFRISKSAPRGIRIYSVESPIKKESAEKMTDEQWLKAVAKYCSEERPFSWDNPEKGGALQLAGTLRELAQNDPERFVNLSLQFPAGTNPVYITQIIDSLQRTSTSTDLKLSVCRKAYREYREACGSAIADLLGSIKDPLPDDAVQMLNWLATEHPNPDRELWSEKASSGQPYYGGDILTHGINTTRGRAAEAIGNLILTNSEYTKRFRSTLDHLANDKSISVRSCVAKTILAAARNDFLLASNLFNRLAMSSERLLATRYVDHFIYLGLHEHFAYFRPYIERMLRSTDTKVSESGARLAGLAALYHESATDLVKEAMNGRPSQRHGIAQVASRNIANGECRAWCEAHLLALFNDGDRDVCRTAASCFRYMENEPLETYESIIATFCDSLAYQENSSPILHMLENTLHRVPGVTCVVCEKFLQRFSDEAKDIRTNRAGDVHTLSKVIFRTYHQHQRDDWAQRCLDLIDRLCLEGILEAKTGFEAYER